MTEEVWDNAMKPENTALVLLAAGRSLRFGAADKLAEPLDGAPLALHAVRALAALPFLARIAVVSDTRLDLAAHGFDVRRNPDPASGLSGSLRIGVGAADALGCVGVVVALADMPCVTADHVLRLLDAADGPDAVVASSDGAYLGPPAVFGRGRFAALLALQGDAGARDLIRAGRHVVADADELLDIDRPDDLARLRAIRGATRRSG